MPGGALDRTNVGAVIPSPQSYIRRERPSTPSAHMARAVRLSPRTALSFAPDGLSLSSSDVPGYSGLKRGAHRAGQSGRALISESRRLLKPGSENGSMPGSGGEGEFAKEHLSCLFIEIDSDKIEWSGQVLCGVTKRLKLFGSDPCCRRLESAQGQVQRLEVGR